MCADDMFMEGDDDDDDDDIFLSDALTAEQYNVYMSLNDLSYMSGLAVELFHVSCM